MKRRLFLLLIILLFALTACEDNTEVGKTDGTKTNDVSTNDDDKTNTDDEKTTDDDTTNTNEDTYVKDGDIINYFMTFGTESDCTELWGYGESATCYEIEITDNGYNITMRYYYLPDAYYKTFDFVAEKSGNKIIIQMDYMARQDTSVVYTGGGHYIDGFLKYNGIDADPMFDLNKNYTYEDWGNGSEDAMQLALNSLVTSVNQYYKDNIDASIVTPTE